ncbi:MAG: hypothetical protein AAGA18_14915 [Verrucomicrobiota bacterium]
MASSVSSDTPSLNNRRITEEGWNAPRLLTEEQNLQTLADGFPDWIYMDRNGPTKPGNFSKSLSENMQDQKLNYDYVVGRYAYRIYDTSGLININVAGTPGNLRPEEVARAERKGSLAWLDLYNNPLPGYAGDSSDPLSIFNWKYDTEAGDYDQYIEQYGQRFGFMVEPPVAEGFQTNRFLDRTDLIYYAYSDTARNQFTAGNPEEFLTHVNTFSGAVNAPNWQPLEEPEASPREMHASPYDVTVTQSFTRRDGTQARIGEPLMKTRFPLSMIALFNPDSDLSQTMTEEERLNKIEAYFGLEPEGLKWRYDEENVKQGSGFSADQEGETSRQRLLTFAEIANEGREPNFFEVLQAGIWPDSLGQTAYDDNQLLEKNADSSNNDRSTNAFRHLQSFLDTDSNARQLSRHIWQIGLNIIDQWDADDDPTVIARNPIDGGGGGVPDDPFGQASAIIDHDLAGIENIPYLFALGHHTTIRINDDINYDEAAFPNLDQDSDGTADFQLPAQSSVTLHWTLNMWNPHRNAAQSEAGEYRLGFHGLFQEASFKQERIDSGAGEIELWHGIPQGSNGSGIVTAHVRNSEASNPGEGSGSPVSDFISFTADAGDFAEPRLLKASDATNYADELGGNDDHYTESGADVFGFYKGKYVLDNYQVPGDPDSNAASVVKNFKDYRFFIDSGQYHIQLEKRVEGSWLPVQTISVIEGELSSYIPRVSKELNYNNNDQQEFSKNGIARLYSFFPDPRVTRFGLAHVGTSDPTRELGLNFDDNVLLSLIDRGGAESVFSGFDSSNQGSYSWSRGHHFDHKILGSNKPSDGQSYSDRGDTEQIRVADNPNATFNYSDGEIENRPIVLNRPFTSIAEMSYAGRDLPWKTLNLLNHEENVEPEEAAADSALLELFSLNEGSVRADMVNLNNVPREVLEAVVANTDVSPMEEEDVEATITGEQAEQLVNEIEDYLGPRDNPINLLTNSVDIAKMIQSLPSFRNRELKVQRDALLSGLTDIHNARTWHLLIDVIAQSGNFTNASRNLEDFFVTGQKHMIVQVAIDRFTGEIVNQQIEQPVEETFD